MLVQVTDTDVFCPLDSAFVGLQFSGNDVHEGRFSFAVGSDQADVFTFEETERHVVENRTVAETVGRCSTVMMLILLFLLFVSVRCICDTGNVICAAEEAGWKSFRRTAERFCF